MDDKPRDPQNEDGFAITPGGSRARKSVHQVGPTEAVHRTESGSYILVPQTSSDERTISMAEDRV
ncbi:MAG: hypothetical protein WA634_08065, partial [Silvibacterium sp.]